MIDPAIRQAERCIYGVRFVLPIASWDLISVATGDKRGKIEYDNNSGSQEERICSDRG